MSQPTTIQSTSVLPHIVASTNAFQGESTIHGLLRLQRTRGRGWPYTQLVIFIPAFIGVVCILSYETWLTVTEYLTYDTKTDVSYPVADTIPFPAITICSNNQFFRDSWGHKPVVYLPFFYETHPQNPFLEGVTMCSSTAPAPAPIFITANGTQAVFEYFGNYSTVMARFNHNSWNSVLSCRWQQKVINCMDVFYNHFVDVGYCFTFNPSATFVEAYAAAGAIGFGTTPEQLGKYNFTVRTPGRRSGAEFLLYVNSSQYCTSGVQYTYGFSALPHDPEMVLPLALESSIEMMPGLAIEVAIVMRTYIKYTNTLPSWSEHYCVYDLPLSMYSSNVPYSYFGCLTECFVNATIQQCNCYPQYTPALGVRRAIHGLITGEPMYNCQTEQQQICQNEVQNTINSQMGIFNYEASINQNCICRHACEQTDYYMQVSASLFPPAGALPTLLRRYNLNESMTLADFRKDYLLVNFFIADMKYTLIEESQAKTLGDLVNDIGGALGLCVGGSLISIAELFMWVGHVSMVAIRRRHFVLFRHADA